MKGNISVGVCSVDRLPCLWAKNSYVVFGSRCADAGNWLSGWRGGFFCKRCSEFVERERLKVVRS